MDLFLNQAHASGPRIFHASVGMKRSPSFDYDDDTYVGPIMFEKSFRLFSVFTLHPSWAHGVMGPSEDNICMQWKKIALDLENNLHKSASYLSATVVWPWCMYTTES